MKNNEPTVEFVEGPVEIAEQATLRSAEESLGMTLRLGRKLDRFVLKVGRGFCTAETAATTVG